MKILTLFLIILSLNSHARNCNTGPQFGIESLQALISISEETADSKTYKKITNEESIYVPGLTQEIFEMIKNDPQKIAEIFGAKLIEEKSSTEFRLAIPVLGFDLSFDVQMKNINSDTMEIEVDNFNTFFHSGAASLKVFQFDDNGATLIVKGHGLIPNTAANMFSFSVGGEKNFKKIIQSEIDTQIQNAIERFKQYY